MSAKAMNNWAGLASIVWMLGVYAVLALVVERRGYWFDPAWLFMSVVLVGWLGVGLLLAIFGLSRGSVVGRVCAMIGVVVFLYFAWQFWLGPAIKPQHQRAMRSNQQLEATSVGACSSAIAVVAFWPEVPQLSR
jgi:hypothetical protein